MQDSLRTAPFPLLMLSDQLTFIELFQFVTRAHEAMGEVDFEIQKLDVLAFAVEDPAEWQPVPRPGRIEFDPDTLSQRVAIMGIRPEIRDLLRSAVRVCADRGISEFAAKIDDEPAMLARFFAHMEEHDLTVLDLSFRPDGMECAVIVLVRTRRTIAKVREFLRISEWREQLIVGWWPRNLGLALPIAELPEKISLADFLAHADENRRTLITTGRKSILGMEAYSVGASTGLGNGVVPERLLITTAIPSLRSALRHAAVKAGAPRKFDDLCSRSEVHAEFLKEIFCEMETRDAPAMAFGLSDIAVLAFARSAQAIGTLMQVLGIGSFTKTSRR